MKTQSRLFQYNLIAFLTIVIVLVSYSIIISVKLKKQGEQLTELGMNYQPSINALSALNSNYEQLKNLVRYWMVSTVHNDSLFRSEYNQIYTENIYPLTKELLLHADKWNMEDTRLMNETAGFIKDSLHTALLNFVKSNYSLRSSENVNYAEINDRLQQGEIIFLFSEIEQNLSYLIDKKRSEAKSILHAIELYGNQIRKSAVYITFIIAIILALFMMFYLQYTINAFTTVLNGLESLSNGRIPAPIPIKKQHAFSILFSRMNLLYDYLARLVTLSKQILEKDFSGDIKPLGDEDQLGKALVDLQSSLRQASEEEEKRKKEDLERQWVSEGIARINDILRISGDKIEDLAYQLIKELVSYTNSSLGALFVVNNDNPEEVFLEMNASYAYDRRKYIEKHINLGEGLVGRCASEKEVLYLTEIPEEDLSIQSGLGESKPVSLLIAPLKIDNSVYGVIELASFEMYEPYQISFIQTIGENIAITISKLKINLSTSILLEQTRKQTRELSAHEEEMRKNMEVLRASQEQSSLREEKLLKEIEQLKKLIS